MYYYLPCKPSHRYSLIALAIFAVLVFGSSKIKAHEQHLSADEQQQLQQIHDAIKEAEAKDTVTVLEKKVSFNPTSKKQWLSLQNKAVLYSQASDDLAFILAFYGTDVAQNLKTMFIPVTRANYEFEHPAAAKLKMSKGQENYFDIIQEALPVRLSLIYQKTHDNAVLASLLDYECDGVAAEIKIDELINIWQKDAVALLKQSGTNRRRIDVLTGMLFFLKEGWSSKEWVNTMVFLDKYSHNSSPQVSAAAKSLRNYAATLSNSQ